MLQYLTDRMYDEVRGPGEWQRSRVQVSDKVSSPGEWQESGVQVSDRGQGSR